MTASNITRLRNVASATFERANSIRQRRRSEQATPPGEDRDHLEVDPAEADRRQRERSKFADDAEYFEFLVSRAVASVDAPSNEETS